MAALKSAALEGPCWLPVHKSIDGQPLWLLHDVRPLLCRFLADCLPIEASMASTPAGLQELQLLVSDAVQLHEEEGKLLAAAIQMTLQSEAST